jgi:hypothetical protein
MEPTPWICPNCNRGLPGWVKECLHGLEESSTKTQAIPYSPYIPSPYIPIPPMPFTTPIGSYWCYQCQGWIPSNSLHNHYPYTITYHTGTQLS